MNAYKMTDITNTMRIHIKRGMRNGLLFLLLGLNAAVPVYATSWVDLPAEDVISRASIVVEGTYDFSKRRGEPKMMWVGYDFKVSKVYRGDVATSLVAGIDGFDTGWADEYQRENGKFLLFLEKVEQVRYPTPIAGPNGMIQIKNGKVQHHDEKEGEAFQAFIDSAAHIMPKQSTGVTGDAGYLWWIAAPLVLIVFLFFLIYRFRRTRS
ncbi:hypothetical protein [Paenibacillus sp. V4I7]|uniref:hypothetical protein n=1 Tax=Paenibacillus sp. V4I7 TaxID=3042307 RepID=UPI002788C9DB|nr:hypothetical protein [Paenibacillus sp. V4I7]MDQ0897411.1 hypothetical protein [Paenibacillus sp. V4I7]